MNKAQAYALRDELLAEGNYTEVYADTCKQHGSFGVETIAVLTEDRYDAKAGKTVKRIVEEVHHLNRDRTGAMYI